MEYKIKEVSNITGISIRMLRHYDEIGLLVPHSRNEAGYRLYSNDDLARLQQILFFKELDFGLKEIKAIITRHDFDPLDALKSQKTLLLKKEERLQKIISAVTTAIETFSNKGETQMDKQAEFKAFDMNDIEEHKIKYAEETKKRFGSTDAYKESANKTARYSKDDWKRIHQEAQTIYETLISFMDKELSDIKIQEQVHLYKEYITKNFYHCSIEIFQELGKSYSADPRFKKFYDSIHPGFADFFSKAIEAYCDSKQV
ncbi:MAG: MerR family transcriptional regulator [bacterium]|nr:MerR family transcriptional regulator [bacterium]